MAFASDHDESAEMVQRIVYPVFAFDVNRSFGTSELGIEGTQ
jgi:hypothetical protein